MFQIEEVSHCSVDKGCLEAAARNIKGIIGIPGKDNFVTG